MAAPSILAEIKADLGIADNASDAWVQRRLNGVWARMEAYTSRRLATPPATFEDDWGDIANVSNQPTPPPLSYQPRASVFLRHFPVTEIVAVNMSGTDGDPTKVRFDPNTGKILSLDGRPARDTGVELLGSAVRITYKAGWEAIRGDLYEIVLAALVPLWTQQKAMAGGLPGAVTGITTADVGSLEFASAPVARGASDPILGPFAAVLGDYVDERNGLGWALVPVTREIVEPPAP